MNKLKIYYIDSNYIDYLRKFDKRVAYNKSRSRPYVGVVYTFNNQTYFAPLSSPKPKHLTMNKNALDIFKINDGELGIVNINNMIPSPISCLTEALPRIRRRLSNYQTSKVDDYINESNKESHFQELLFKYIDDKNLKDSDVYNKVHIDRRLFSKIRSDINYHPSKETVILLGLSLKLNEKEIDKLLNSASYSLPKNNIYDLIIRFCFSEGIYELKDVNDLLETYNCKLFSY